MSYRRSLLSALFLASVTFNLQAAPRGVGTGDERILVSSISGTLTRRPVRGLLYVPAGLAVTERAPIIIFYHGSSRSPEAFRSYARATIIPWMQGRRAILLSVQNLYGLARTYRDTGRGLGETHRATLEFIDRLRTKYGYRGPVFATGASAGGMMAMTTVLKKPKAYTGIGSFKGNFYSPGFFYDTKGKPQTSAALTRNGGGIYLGVAGNSSEEIQAMYDGYTKRVRHLRVFLSVGGVRELARIKQQARDAMEWFKYRDIRYTFRQYPREGHGFTRHNFLDFWT